MSNEQYKNKEVPTSESQGASLSRDKETWQRIEEIIQENGHGTQYILELFPAYIRRLHMGRFLAHYELFKQTIDLPGCIVELGVYRGVSFLTWTKLMEMFCPGDRKRKIYGFENFKGLQSFTEQDGKQDAGSSKVEGGYSAASVKSEVEQLVEVFNKDSFVPEAPRCELVLGDVQESIPRFLKENPGLRISLLHFDVDLYEPTLLGLEHLYPLVVTGGVVVFDEYGLMPWQGESNAVDEYFKKQGEMPDIRKFPFTTQPHGYIIK